MWRVCQRGTTSIAQVECESLVRAFGHQSTSAGRLVAEMAQTRSQVIAKLMEGEQK